MPQTQSRQAFLETRQASLGSSDIAALVGLDSYSTALDVYYDKVRILDDDPARDSGHSKRGIYLEGVAADAYQNLTGRSLLEAHQCRHPELPWATCHPDRWILDDHEPSGILEIKCPAVRIYERHRIAGPDKGTVVQHQWQLFVTGLEWGSIESFNADYWDQPLFWDFPIDKQLVGTLKERAEEFWENHIQKRIPPPIDKFVDALATPQVDPELQVHTEQDWQFAFQTLRAAHSLRELGKARYEAACELVSGLMKDLGAVEVPGVGKVYYKPRPGGKQFNAKRLRKAQPLDYDAVWLHLQAAGHLEPEVLELFKHCRLDLSKFEDDKAASRPFTFYPEKE